MPVIVIRTALGANATAFPLAGSQFEFLPYNAKLEFANQADATGVLQTIQSGTDILAQESPIQVGTINVQPKYPDDFYLDDIAGAGERIGLQLRDTSGVARVVLTVIRITPL